jgi:hypothetical protein
LKPELQAAVGSPLWQTIFLVFAALLVLFEIARGWRLGLPRQLVRVGAVIAAYAAAWFGGRLLLPMVRPFLKMPDFIIAIVAGAVLALLVYIVITSVGTILFKRTAQQESGIVKILYGFSGAAIGFLFGAFLVWLLVVGIRSLGSVAEVQLHASAENSPAKKFLTAPATRRRVPAAENLDSSLMVSLARLKNSVELGSVGQLVKTADVVPSSTYQTLGKLGKIASDPESAQRFLSYPGAKELSDNPKILALRADPEVTDMIAHGKFMDLLQDQRLIEAANDPALAAQVKSFQFQKALDYATKGK